MNSIRRLFQRRAIIESHRRASAIDESRQAMIAELYRWQVELFFKWIKQHLRIKVFYETTENAVKTQVWIAISVYVLVAIIKKELNLDRSLREILQILSMNLFEKTLLFEVLSQSTVEIPINPTPN